MISNCKWCHKSEDQICKIFTADVQLCPNYIQDGIVNSEKAYIYIYIYIYIVMVTFYAFLHHEKSKWLFNNHDKNFWTRKRKSTEE